MAAARWERVPDPAPLWHVTMTVAGPALPVEDVRAALERLAFERPFLLLGSYGLDRAELHYWEEAPTLADAGALAHGVWPEHRVSARLPPWELVGLEVVDRPTYLLRCSTGAQPGPLLRCAGDTSRS